MNADRYAGRPLVRLLELYVLWAIEELDAGLAAQLVAMTPKLRATYGLTGAWHEIIEQVMSMPPQTKQSLLSLWRQPMNAGLVPQAFAEQVVDRNFVPSEPDRPD